MTVFKSKIDTKSEAFLENRKDMLTLVDKLNELNLRGPTISEKRKDRFRQRGQLTPRERLAELLDPGMPFLCLGNLAGYIMDGEPEEKSIPGSTVIMGIGFIHGVRCMITVDDSGIRAGAMMSAAGAKLIRGMEIARRHKLPFVHLVESAGGDLMNYRVEGFVFGGKLFAQQARLSKAGVPLICLLHGSSTAGGAYMPGMSDYVVAVKGGAKAFLAGPPLLKAATGEIATEEELGGAEMHASVSGLAEYLAENDSEAVKIGREIIDHLNWNSRCKPPQVKDYLPPVYDPDEIAGVVPTDYKKPYDVREVIARIVDGSNFVDFKPRYGVSTVCVQSKIFGQSCGIIGNNGPIDPDGAAKSTQFMHLCDQADTPVIFLQNTTGYIVGSEYERRGMIKHGSKMIQAVTNIEVPRITLMIGASYGAGNYGMCGQGMDPDFVLTWPNASTGVMGGEQAATVMTIVAESAAERTGNPVDRNALNEQEKFLTNHFNSQAHAFHTSGFYADDGMIDPRDTRKALGFLLETVIEARHRTVKPNSFGIARF